MVAGHTLFVFATTTRREETNRLKFMSKIMPITKATKNIQPPLKKSELVEALAIRELENMRKEQAEIRQQIAATKKALYDPAIVDVIRRDGKCDERRDGEPFTISAVYHDNKREAASLQITLSLTPSADVRRLYRKLRELEGSQIHDHNMPSLYQVKQRISAKIQDRASAGQRVTALLKNPETSKALDDTLAALKQPALLAIAN
jgi:hypothetical protein